MSQPFPPPSDPELTFKGARPKRARQPGALERAWGWCCRHPLPVLVVVGGALALLGGLVWWQTRATAWLELHVSTPKAVATLDGEPLALENGSARVRRRAGRYKLVVRAPEHLDEIQEVRLVRGEGNATVVKIDLQSWFGTARVTSLPEGAVATVSTGKQGKTPVEFRLKAGKYMVRVDQELYEPAQQSFTVEAGKVVVVPTLTLKFNTKAAAKGQALFELWDRLGKPREEAFDAVPRGQPIREYLNWMGKESGAHIAIDPGLDNPTLTIGYLYPMRGSPLQMLAYALGGHKLEVIPQQVKKKDPELVVVTQAEARRRPYHIVHNVRDLVEGKGALSRQALLEAARKSVGQPGDWAEKPVEPKKDEPAPATLKFLEDGAALEVRGPWAIQVGVRNNLLKLREARR